ncbi:adenylate/guanylate cyclase domain-containing protein [Rhodoferax sp.]|uniref:adenylate/guanylate cyclase domain-containing protein n=1 Tax=Rhodoferax sp. TaxID=50421 RepID=UPI0025CD236B|nr:adenylate/guanylate cyclase domain-containing protein [Rhodoferax sp.]
MPLRATTWGLPTLWAGYLLLLALAAVLLCTPLARPLEYGLLDAQQRLLLRYAPQQVHKEVVVVGIDEATLQQFAEPFALWHSHLGRFFRGMALAQPAVVGLDVVLPNRSFDAVVPGSDLQLLRGLIVARQRTPLVLGVSADDAGQPRPIYPPFLAMAGSGGSGSLLLSPDADHVVRRFNEQLGASSEPVPTLAGQMLRKIRPRALPQSGLINYALPPLPHYIPLQQVTAWADAGDMAHLTQAFAGKPVLLGSVLSLEDRLLQPVNLAGWEPDNGRTVPGVLVHAQILRSLLNGGLVEPVAWGWIAVLAGLCSLLWFVPLRLRAAAQAALLGMLLAVAMWCLQHGVYLAMGVPVLVGLLALAGRWTLTAVLEKGERRRLRAAFAGYVSPRVMQEIVRGHLAPALGGELRHVCILFADIRGFTSLSETLSAQQILTLLNRYFEQVNQAIHDQGGTISCFMGDGIMAIFGAPQTLATPSVPAFAAARAMLAALDKLNATLQAEGTPPIAIGIGLHVGDAIVGHLGSQARHDYSAIGDTVNVASRIEGLTKDLGHPLVCSQAVVAELAQFPFFTDLGAQAVKGHTPVHVWGWKPGPGG